MATPIEAAMNFTFGDEKEAAEAAKQAEYTGGNFVKEPGAYAGIVESAVFKKFPSGAGGVEIVIKTEEGLACKVMIITMKKDGTSTYKNAKGELMPLPGINQIRGALMPCLRQRDLVAQQGADGEIIYPTVVGQQLGMLVNIRKTLGKTDGKPDSNKVYDNADLKTFYCPRTFLCGSEIINKVAKPERMEKIREGLKIIDETAIANAPAGATNPADPFGDANAASAPVADPFADSTPAPAPAPVAPAPVDPAPVAPVADPAPVAETPAPVADPAPVTPAPAAGSAASVDDFWK